MEEPGRFHDATLVRIRQPDRTGGAALPIAHEKNPRAGMTCFELHPFNNVTGLGASY